MTTRPSRKSILRVRTAMVKVGAIGGGSRDLFSVPLRESVGGLLLGVRADDRDSDDFPEA